MTDSERSNYYKPSDPPCDSCGYAKGCTIECAEFTRWVLFDKPVKPPKEKEVKMEP